MHTINQQDMKISDEEKQELEELYQYYLNNKNIKKMDDIQMHRGSSCYIHSFRVAKRAVQIATSTKRKYNLKNILVGAILHDYYLYDWRTNKALLKKHGKRHPFVANENAKKDFDISPEISEIILSHMWPLTLKYYPHSREAKLVNYVDDITATKEALTSRRYKKKHHQRYIKLISHLFESEKTK